MKTLSNKIMSADHRDGKHIVALYDKECVVVFDNGYEVLRISSHNIHTPVIRKFANGNYLLVSSRIRPGSDSNGFIYSKDGKLKKKFTCGDAIADIIILQNRIAITYFDEGVYGDYDYGHEGIVFLDHSGEYQWGYHTTIEDFESVSDCYAACPISGESIAVMTYMDFPIIEINSIKKTQRVHRPPSNLYSPLAISHKGDYYYIVKDNHEVYRYNHKRLDNIIKVGLVAESQEICIRGLSNGRFLIFDDKQVSVVEFE